MNYVVRMLAMTNCSYSPMHWFTVVVALQYEAKINRGDESGLFWAGLLWTWSVLNGLSWVVCYERVCFEWKPFWSIVMFLWVTSFKLFTVIGFNTKAPSYRRWWWQLHLLQQFWPQKYKCKLQEMILKFSGWVESLINNAHPDRQTAKKSCTESGDEI